MARKPRFTYYEVLHAVAAGMKYGNSCADGFDGDVAIAHAIEATGFGSDWKEDAATLLRKMRGDDDVE